MLLSVVQLNIVYTCLSFNEHSLRSVHLNERCTRTCLRETSLYPPPPPLITAQREQLFASTLNHISPVSSFRRRFCDFSPTSRSFGNSCAGSTKDWALLYSDSAWFGPRPRQRLFWQVLLHFPKSLQINAWVASEMTLRSLPWTSFPIHCYLLTITTADSVS
jgi:hypothetical protein